jgi:hypothetical protein
VPQRSARDDCRRDQGDAAANQCVDDAADIAPRRKDRDDDDRLDRSLVDQQHARVEQDRGGHGERHNDGDLDSAAAGDAPEHVRDADPDGASDADLGDPAQPLPVRRPEAQHRCDRGEERRGVVEQLGRDRPRGAGGDRALADHPGLVAQSSQASGERQSAALPGGVTQRRQVHVGILAAAPRSESVVHHA